jgi:flagellar motility protein MotE (MotC chaperone)
MNELKPGCIECECGTVIKKTSRYSHVKTRKHQRLMEGGPDQRTLVEVSPAGSHGRKRRVPLGEGETTYYSRHTDKAKADATRWREKNREAYNAYHRRRYAENKAMRERKLKQMHNYRVKQRLKTLEEQTEGNRENRL